MSMTHVAEASWSWSRPNQATVGSENIRQPEEPKRPFLVSLTVMRMWEVQKHYLDNWPGRVALIVGGSNDMRLVKQVNHWTLWDAGITIMNLHSRTEQNKLRRLPEKCLLLCTETLFREDRTQLRADLHLVFDTCVVHRVLHEKEEDCQWSDVLSNIKITKQEHDRRLCLLGRQKYCPKLPPADLPPKQQEQPLTVPEKQSKICPPYAQYLGESFPVISYGSKGGEWALKKLLTQNSSSSALGDAFSPPSELWDVDAGGESLSFNQLPIIHLLHESLNRSDVSRSQRSTCLLGACVVQLVSSKAMELLFRDRAMVDACEGDCGWLWQLIEAPKFLQVFLTSAGKHDMICALCSLTVQWMQARAPAILRGHRHKDLRNLDGQSFGDFAASVFGAFQPLAKTAGWLLVHLMQLMEKLIAFTLTSSDEWSEATECDLCLDDIWALKDDTMLPFLRSQLCRAAVVRFWGWKEIEEPGWGRPRKEKIAALCQLGWKVTPSYCYVSMLEVSDEQDIRVTYPNGADFAYETTYNPFDDDEPLLKTVLKTYFSDAEVAAGVFPTGDGTNRAATVLSKLVAATSIFTTLKELAPRVNNGDEDDYDGIPAQDQECEAEMLPDGSLEGIGQALAAGWTRAPVAEVVSKPDPVDSELEDDAKSTAEGESGHHETTQPEMLGHVLRMQCLPLCLINPFTRGHVVMLALNRFMTPKLLSVTAALFLQDGELEALSPQGADST